MPSNTKLAEEAEKLAEGLGIEVTTDGKNNEQLSDLVSDLRAKTKDAEHDTEADQGKPAPAPAPAKKAAPKPKKPPYYVAPGKAITSRKGILSGDTADEVKAEYLSGGKGALDAFIESGHVLKG